VAAEGRGGLRGGLAVVSGRVCDSSTRWGPRGKIKVKGGVGVCLGILCHFQLFSKR
jgi:formylmethanofuran dehydrogenase subunit C